MHWLRTACTMLLKICTTTERFTATHSHCECHIKVVVLAEIFNVCMAFTASKNCRDCVKFSVQGHYHTHCTHSIAHHSTHSPYTQSVPTILENVTDSCGSGQLPYPGTVCVRPWYCKERLKMATVTLLTTYSKAPDRPWTGTGAGGWISTAPPVSRWALSDASY